MKIKYYIFRIYPNREYDHEEVFRFVKVSDPLTIDGFECERDAENWVMENGAKNLEYIVLKTLKPNIIQQSSK